MGISDDIYKRVLIDIENRIVFIWSNKLSLYGLTEINQTSYNTLPTDIISETSYATDVRIQYVNENKPKLLSEQNPLLRVLEIENVSSSS